MGRAKVVDILVKRDGISKQDANDLIDLCVQELYCGNHEAIMEYLALEDDYIFDILE